MSKRRRKSFDQIPTHMLLHNYRALMFNATYAPQLFPGFRESHVARLAEASPKYRAEFERRGMAIPDPFQKESYDALLAKALKAKCEAVKISEPIQACQNLVPDKWRDAFAEATQICDLLCTSHFEAEPASLFKQAAENVGLDCSDGHFVTWALAQSMK